VFTNSRLLTELTGLPVLGSVHRTWLEQHRAAARRTLRRVALASVGLVAMFLVVLLLNQSGARFLHAVLPLSLNGT
jgi:hypothetical protein